MAYSFYFFGLVALTAFVAGFCWTVGAVCAGKLFAR